MSSNAPDSSFAADDETIQRVLFLSPTVHIYTVPPLTSTKGYTTTSWSPLTSPPPNPQPITTRLRVLETSSSSSSSTPSNPTPNGSTAPSQPQQQPQSQQQQTIKTSILLEDPTTGALFAESPYTSPLAVQPTTDSSRFFALRVEGDGGRMKAVLGIGFEERGEAMDFGICLQGVRKVMGMDVNGNGGGVVGKGKKGEKLEKEGKRNWGLKEGETIRVEIGGMGMGTGGGVESRRRRDDGEGKGEDEGALFSIKPPPSSSESGKGGGMPLLAPPPSARDVKAERRRSREVVIPEKGSAAELGFDDGEFGEFQ